MHCNEKSLTCNRRTQHNMLPSQPANLMKHGNTMPRANSNHPLLRSVEKPNTFANRFGNFPYNLMFLNYFFNMDRIML